MRSPALPTRFPGAPNRQDPYPRHAISCVTLCIRPSSRPVEKYPPLCSQAMRVGVMLVAAQNWHSCARGCFWLADQIDGSLT
jgi:hypothetical protein